MGRGEVSGGRTGAVENKARDRHQLLLGFSNTGFEFAING